MKRFILFLGILSGLMLLPSCREVARHNQLKDLWTYIDSAPDSALQVLEAMPSEHFLLPRDRADYALLKSIALDKNYIDLTDDSLARIATNWYEIHGRPERQLRAWYYLGRVQQNARNASGAIVSFQKAHRLAKEAGDLFYEGMVCRAMADVYRDAFFKEEALANMRRAFDCFVESGYPVHADYALLDIARMLASIGQESESEAVFLQVIERAHETHNNSLLSLSIQSYAYMLSNTCDDYQRIIDLLKTTTIDSTSTTSIICAMAVAYDGLGMEKEANSYLRLAEKVSSDTFDRAVVASESFRIARRRQKGEQAIRYLKIASDAQDSLFLHALRQSVVVAQRDAYQMSLTISEKKSEKRRLFLWFTVLALLSCMGLFLMYRKKTRLEYENAIFQISSLNDEIRKMEILTSERDKQVARLFQNHLQLFNDFSGRYLKQDTGSRSPDKSMMMLIQKQIDELVSDKSILQELESIVNYTCDNAMSLFREEVRLKPHQYDLVCCYFAGLSGNAIRLLTGETRSNIYTSRHRILILIKQIAPPHEDIFLRYLNSD